MRYSGVGIAGTGLRLVNYPAGVSSVESMDVLTQLVYFAAVGVIGGLYACNLLTLKVDVLLKNNLGIVR